MEENILNLCSRGVIVIVALFMHHYVVHVLLSFSITFFRRFICYMFALLRMSMLSLIYHICISIGKKLSIHTSVHLLISMSRSYLII